MNNQLYTCLVLKKILITPRLSGGNILDSEDRFMYPLTELLLKRRINEMKLQLKQEQDKKEKIPEKNKIDSILPSYLVYLYS